MLQTENSSQPPQECFFQIGLPAATLELAHILTLYFVLI